MIAKSRNDTVGSREEHADKRGAKAQKGIVMEAFDYIVVGGGTAGCVLAARLSQDPGVRVPLAIAERAASLLFGERTVSC